MFERCEHCGKKNFPTYEWAQAMAAVYKHLNGWRAYPYLCTEGGKFWHLTTPEYVKHQRRRLYSRIAKAMRRLHEQRSNDDNGLRFQPEEE